MLNKFVVALLIVALAAMAYIAYDTYFVEHPTPIAKIVKSKGLVNIRRGVDVITGQKGELLYQGDQLSTNKSSVVRVQLADGSVLVLGAKSSFGFTRYDYSADTKTLFAQFKYLKGAVRMVTGRVEMKRKLQIADAQGTKLGLSQGDLLMTTMNDERTVLVFDTTKTVTLSNKRGKQSLLAGTGASVAARSAPSEPMVWPDAKVAQALALVFEG